MPDTSVATATPIKPRAAHPVGVNHVVLNVRDMEESHRFWTEVAGLKWVGQLSARPGRPSPPKMRFYSVDHGGGQISHHDVALVENPDLPRPEAIAGAAHAVHHVALTMPDRETWLAHLAYLQERGVVFDRRTEHGPTHSLYIRDPNGYGVELLYERPRETWEGDLDAALNYYVALPTEGPAALQDSGASAPLFGAKQN